MVCMTYAGQQCKFKLCNYWENKQHHFKLQPANGQGGIFSQYGYSLLSPTENSTIEMLSPLRT